MNPGLALTSLILAANSSGVVSRVLCGVSGVRLWLGFGLGPQSRAARDRGTNVIRAKLWSWFGFGVEMRVE